jgi:hypothetical protein
MNAMRTFPRQQAGGVGGCCIWVRRRADFPRPVVTATLDPEGSFGSSS